jgi:hypothetical protein
MTHNCLNCEKELIDKYCYGCGQKADTHRITFKHFIFHDLLHGTFHFEKGMLFTGKQALLRPGQAALDYISGKRIRFYNVFYLILITIGLIAFLHHFYDVLDPNGVEPVVKDQSRFNEGGKIMNNILAQQSKIIIFLFVPLSALTGLLLFRRKKLNLSEHAIIAGMILLGMLLTSLFGNLVFYLELIRPFPAGFAKFLQWMFPIIIPLQIGYGYFNAFRSDYSKFGIAYRIVLFYALLFLEIVFLFLLVFGIVSHWKFGLVDLSNLW